jgi:hypothetical protein
MLFLPSVWHLFWTVAPTSISASHKPQGSKIQVLLLMYMCVGALFHYEAKSICNLYKFMLLNLGKGKFNLVLNSLSTLWRCMGKWGYGSTILDLSTIRKWVGSFTS